MHPCVITSLNSQWVCQVDNLQLGLARIIETFKYTQHIEHVHVISLLND